MIGLLGRAIFMSSSLRSFTMRNMAREADPRIEEHEVIGQKSKLEFVAPGLEEFTFDVRLDVSFGVAPEMELKKLRDSRDKGESLPFIVGGKYIGNFLITSLKEGHQVQNQLGITLIANAEITIREDRQEWQSMMLF